MLDNASIVAILWFSCSILLFFSVLLSTRLTNEFACLQVMSKAIALAWLLAIGAVLLLYPNWLSKLLLLLCFGLFAINISASLLAHSMYHHLPQNTDKPQSTPKDE